MITTLLLDTLLVLSILWTVLGIAYQPLDYYL